MRRRVALAGAVLLALLATSLPAPVAAGSQPVAALPEIGDAARYEGYERVVGPEGIRNESRTWTLTWSMDRVDLPDGSARRMPTLTYEVLVPNGSSAAESARHLGGLGMGLSPQGPLSPAAPNGSEPVRTRVLDIATHYTGLPSQAAGFSIAVLDEQTSGRYWRVFRLTGFPDGWCASAPLGPILGRSAQAAEAASRRCLAEIPWGRTLDVDLETGWVEAPRYGETWLREATVRYRTPDGIEANATFRLRTSPQLSVPVERRVAWTQPTPQGLERRVRSFHLTGWAAGDGAFPSTEPVPSGPAVPIVPWTREGPQIDWSPGLTFLDAREAVRSTGTSESYHADHPEAHLTMATYLRRHADDRSTQATSAANLGKCRNPAVPTLEGTRGPSPVEAGWVFFVSGDTEDLYGQADAPYRARRLRSAGVDAPEQTQVSTFDSDGLSPGFTLPHAAPSPRALLEHVELADRIGARGDPYAAIRPASNEGLIDGTEPPLDGLVGRLRCMLNPATGTYSYQDAGIVFQGGQAMGVYSLRVEAIGDDPTGLASLPAPPTGSPGDEVGPLELGVAGVALGALLWALLRGGLPLYHRLQGRDLLDHPVRERIQELVRDRPGVSLTELSEATDRHRSTVEYHVHRMEEDGFLEARTTPSGLVAFPVGHPLASDAEVIARGQARAFVRAVGSAPGGNLTRYAERLGVSKGYLSGLARELAEAGLIDRAKEGRELVLRPGPRASLLEDGGGPEAPSPESL